MRIFAVFLFLVAPLLILLSGCVSPRQTGESAVSAYNKANSFRDGGDSDSAVEYYRKTLDLDPDFLAAEYNLSLVLAESGDFDSSIEMLESMKERMPDSLKVLKALAWVYYSAGRKDDAVSCYLDILSLSPGETDAALSLAGLYTETGNFEKAVEYYKKVFEIRQDKESCLDLVKVFSDMGDYRNAYLYSQKGLFNFNNDEELLAAAADSAVQLDLPEDALFYYGKAAEALKDSTKKAGIYFKMAEIQLTQAGNFSKGVRMLKLAVESGFSDSKALGALLKDSPSQVRPAVRDVINNLENPSGEATFLEESSGEND